MTRKELLLDLESTLTELKKKYPNFGIDCFSVHGDGLATINHRYAIDVIDMKEGTLTGADQVEHNPYGNNPRITRLKFGPLA